MAWLNLTLCWNNYVQLATTTLTASTADANFPVGNIAYDQRRQIWKSTGASGQWVQIDLGAGYASLALPRCAIIYDANCVHIADPIGLTSGNTDPPTANAFVALTQFNLTPATATVHVPQRVVVFPEPITDSMPATAYRYWCFSQVASIVSFETVFSAGKIFLGQAYTFSKNAVHPLTRGFIDQSPRVMTPNQAINVNRIPTRRTLLFTVPAADDTQIANLQTIMDAVGTHTPISIIAGSTDMRMVYYGYFTSLTPFIWRNKSIWDLAFEFEEAV